jgi:hypothetical protein
VTGGGMQHHGCGGILRLEVVDDKFGRQEFVVHADEDGRLDGYVLGPQHKGVPQKKAAKSLHGIPRPWILLKLGPKVQGAFLISAAA